MEQKQSLLQFSQEVLTFPLPEQCIKWKNEIKYQQESNESQLHLYLERFNEYFPFNTQHWTKLAYIELKKGKPDCIKIFQLALAKNPKSISLWKQYFSWLRDTIKESDPDFLSNDLERGLAIIGKHPQSKLIYDYWFESSDQNNILKIFQMRVKMITSILCLNDETIKQSRQWLSKLNSQNIQQIIKNQGYASQNNAPPHQILNAKFQDLIVKSIQKYEPFQQFQCKIQGSEYKPYQGNILIWRSYIQYLKKQNYQQLSDVYERALIANCEKEGLWKQFFEYIEFECSSVNKILSTFRSIPIFFKNFNIDLLCYWVQLEETQNVYKARQLIVQLLQAKPTLQLFNRHLQLQIRAKDFSNGKIIYQSILNVFSNNIEIISFIVIEYIEFIVKYFRDFELCKRILRAYFEKYPFNLYLFYGYLEFYIKNIELESGNKEVFNQLMEIVKSGITRAYKILDQSQYKSFLTKTTHLIRNYLPNVFLLKSAEKMIIETELSVKNIEMQQILKANKNKFEGIQTLSKRRKIIQAQEDDKLQSLY